MVISASAVQADFGRKELKNLQDQSVDANQVITVILGGGQGKRLFPLTQSCCKPAICFGGRYRLIDVPLSNAINSGFHKIFIVTQFLSSSLHRYISQTYNIDAFSPGFIDVLSAEQKPDDPSGWYQGTADAIRKNLENFRDTSAEYFLILSGDQLYNFDFRSMLRYAIRTDADVVVAALPIGKQEVKRMGVLQLDSQGKIRTFHEKPQDESLIKELETPRKFLEEFDLNRSSSSTHVGSMGIYVFKRKVMYELLENLEGMDFGKDILPVCVEAGIANAYLYDGYWEDIGTIEAFYNANMILAQSKAPFNCYDEGHPIYTARYNLPGPKVSHCYLNDSIICEGSIIEAEEIKNSIIGPRTVIGKDTMIYNSYIMGNDFYELPYKEDKKMQGDLQIGERCLIKRAILDKNVSIGNGVKLINHKNLQSYDGEGIYIRDGIIVVARGTSVPDHFTL
ncbi:MAG: glucose-1-phosphate adenylyltransferase [Chlamydiales bacterium]